MLSRHAEGLFWMGRYIERAAYITRMLDVASHKQLEAATDVSAQIWHDMLEVLNLLQRFQETYGSDTSTASVNNFLVFDRSNSSSVAASVIEARRNVMNVRDIVPIELLETINQLHVQLTGRRLERFVERSPHELYEAVARHCRAISGAIDDAMPRDDGYRFLVLGRMLERAEMTCRMVTVNRAACGSDMSAWMSVLRSVSGFHGFMQQYGPLAPADDVVRFMLQEPTFPFSLFHCLERSSAVARELSGSGSWKSARHLGRISAELHYADVPKVEDSGLEAFLDRLQESIQTASAALHDDLYQFGGDPLVYSFEAM